MSITLHAAGVEFGGWTDIRVSASLESVARTFGFGVATAKQFKLASGWIRPGTPCEVKIGGTPVCKGYVVKPDYSYSKRDTTFVVEGASRTIDLVQCDITTKPNRWRNATIRQIILGLITPHDIELVVDPAAEGYADKRIKRFKVAQGTKVHSAIDDLVDDYGLMLTDDAQGRLVLTRVGETVTPPKSFTAIVEGNGGNVLNGRFTADGSGLFSDYICKGQRGGSDTDTSEGIALVSGSVTDQTIGRWRPTLIRPEKSVTAERAKDLARWRAANATAKAAQSVYTVGGWKQGNGALWAPGLLVPVLDERVGLDMEMLVVSVDYIRNREMGEATQMTLAPPAAYRLLGPDEYRRKPRAQQARAMSLDEIQAWVWIGDSIGQAQRDFGIPNTGSDR